MKDKYQAVVVKALIFIIDFWLINIAFLSTPRLGVELGNTGTKEVTSFLLIFSLIWIIAGSFFKIYRIDTVSLMRNISINILGTFAVHMLMVISILSTFNIFTINGGFLVCVYVMTGILV